MSDSATYSRATAARFGFSRRAPAAFLLAIVCASLRVIAAEGTLPGPSEGSGAPVTAVDPPAVRAVGAPAPAGDPVLPEGSAVGEAEPPPEVRQQIERERIARERAMALRTSAQEHPDDPLVQATWIEGLLDLGFDDEALDQAGGLVERFPKFAPLWAGFGRALARDGQFDLALLQFKRAIALDASQARAHALAGRVALVRGDALAAEPLLRRALALDPTQSDPRRTLESLLERAGRYAEALELLDAPDPAASRKSPGREAADGGPAASTASGPGAEHPAAPAPAAAAPATSGRDVEELASPGRATATTPDSAGGPGTPKAPGHATDAPAPPRTPEGGAAGGGSDASKAASRAAGASSTKDPVEDTASRTHLLRQLAKEPPFGLPSSFGTVTVPFVTARGYPPFVKVRIGESFEKLFQIDTGSEEMLLTAAAARALGLPDRGRENLRDAEGRQFAAPAWALLDALRIGDLTVRRVPVKVSLGMKFPDDQVAGAIGRDLLRRFRVVLDYSAGTLTLARPGNPPLGGVPFDLSSVILLQGSTGDRRAGAWVLDTSSYTPGVLDAKFVAEETNLSLFSPNVKLIENGGAYLFKFTFPSLTVGGLEYTRFPATAVDLRAMSRMLGVNVRGVLGHAMLRNCRLEIDFRDQKLSLTRVRAPAEAGSFPETPGSPAGPAP